jgi:phosphate transport system substrate-binding protein
MNSFPRGVLYSPRMRRFFLLFLTATLATTVAAAQQYTIIGSKTMYAMNVALAKRFEQTHPGVKFTISGEGTAKGFEAVLHRKADAAAMTRALRPEEKKAIRAAMNVDGDLRPIALEGISIYLHPRNPVSALKPEQVFAIFSGRITNWKEVGGRDAAIHVYSFDNSTGRYWYLFDELMARAPFVKTARYTDEHPDLPPPEGLARKEEQMLDWVSQDADAIGFGDLKKVRIVKIAQINGSWPTADDIRTRRYPFARPLGYVVGANPPAKLVEYIRWAATQDDVIRDAGFVPIE